MDVGVRLRVEVRLLPTEAGGRTRPIMSGYRPVCRLLDGLDPAYVGLNEVDLDEPLQPGGMAIGFIRFHADVSDTVKARVSVGSELELTEGPHVVGFARVLEIGTWQPATHLRTGN